MSADAMVRLWQNRRRLWWLALLLGGTAMLTLVLIMDHPQAELLTQPPAARGPRLAFLGGGNSPVRVMVRRIRTRLFRPPGQVMISAEAFDLTSALALTNLILLRPVLSNESVQVWLLRTNEMHEVAVARARQEAGQLGPPRPNLWAPRLLTADGRPAQILMARDSRNSGVDYFVVPRIRRQSVDAEWFVTSFNLEKTTLNSNQRSTNFAVGARLLIPPDCQVFMLTATNATGQRMGMTLSTTILPSGK